MQIWAEPKKSALPICNYSQILYRFLTFTQNLKRSRVDNNIIYKINHIPIFIFKTLFLYFLSIYYVKTKPPKYIKRQPDSNNTILPVGLKRNNSLNSTLK